MNTKTLVLVGVGALGLMWLMKKKGGSPLEVGTEHVVTIGPGQSITWVVDAATATTVMLRNKETGEVQQPMPKTEFLTMLDMQKKVAAAAGW